MRGVLGEGGFGTVVMVKNGEQMSAHVPWMTGLQTVASGEHGARTCAVPWSTPAHFMV